MIDEVTTVFFAAFISKINVTCHFLYIIIFQPYQSYEPPSSTRGGDRHMRPLTFLQGRECNAKQFLLKARFHIIGIFRSVHPKSDCNLPLTKIRCEVSLSLVDSEQTREKNQVQTIWQKDSRLQDCYYKLFLWIISCMLWTRGCEERNRKSTITNEDRKSLNFRFFKEKFSHSDIFLFFTSSVAK